MSQIVESAAIHGSMSPTAAEAKAVALFNELALPNPETVGRRYPHQVSGGQLQRLLAAMALLNGPRLVIFDEPTTALDVTTQIEVLRAFKKVVRDRGTTALYVSHDLAVVAQMADRIIVLRDGAMQEMGATEQVLRAPESSYTQSLLAAAEPVARVPAARPAGTAAPLLEVEHLTAGYGGIGPDGMPRIPVIRDVSFTIPAGSTLGIIGESGCGKSTLARIVAGLLPQAGGEVRLDGAILPPSLAERSREQLRQIQIVFQMADTALNPGQTIGRILGRPLTFYKGLRGEARRRRVAELLDMVRLPADAMHRYPGELSGGQKQRANLARALAAEPKLILCDEVTSALDTVVAAAVLDLLAELKRELQVSYMFISHDLSTVRAICDEVMILYSGQMMELGSRAALNTKPLHPYSDLLIASVPELRTGWLDGLDQTTLGEASAGTGGLARSESCSFFPRCAQRIPGRCDTEPTPWRHLAKGATIRCQRTEAELLAHAAL
jgi:peptide/nickel transport system ATP-binding protein